MSPGRACTSYQGQKIVGLRCRIIQCDEICAFIY